MIEEFKYGPPLKYLFVGCCGLILLYIFGSALLSEGELWFKIIIGFFAILGMMLAIGFFILFFRKYNIGNLKLGNNFIEIPGRWKNRVKLNFEEIIEIGEIDTYDNVIEIRSRHGIYLIEKSWMYPQDFDKVKMKLKKYFLNKVQN